MYFTKTIISALLLAAANAAVQLTDASYSGITVGQPFNITWSGNTGAVTLYLKNGPALVQQAVSTIATGVSGSSYLWTPSSSVPSGTYNLEIQDANGDINYSIQFPIVGGASSSAASSTAAASTSMASSSAVVASSSTAAASSMMTSTMAGSTASGASSTAAAAKTTSGASTPTTAASPAATTGAAVRYDSPFALVLGAAAVVVAFA